MNSRYDNSLTKYADGMAISYTYKMTGLDHTILNRSKYGLLSDSEKEEIMCNLAENYFMSYKGLRSYDRWGRTQVYVSSGLGLWGPPFRIGTDSEMVIVDFRFR